MQYALVFLLSLGLALRCKLFADWLAVSSAGGAQYATKTVCSVGEVVHLLVLFVAKQYVRSSL